MKIYPLSKTKDLFLQDTTHILVDKNNYMNNEIVRTELTKRELLNLRKAIEEIILEVK